MAITNYGELKTATSNWLNRTDLDQRVPEFIALAIGTLNAIYRDTFMVAQDTIAITAGTRYAAVPSTMLEPIFLTDNTTAAATLEQVTAEHLANLRKQMTTAATPRFYAIIGRRLELCPVPGSNGTLEMAHYRTIAALSNDSDTNIVLTNRPDVMLYATLYHAAPFLKDDVRAGLFGNALVQQIQALVEANSRVIMETNTPGPTLTSPRDVK